MKFLARWILAFMAVSSVAGPMIAKDNAAPSSVIFTGESATSFASGVGVPANRAYFYTSGITAAVIKKDGTTIYERMGDTYVQSVSCLTKIEKVLSEQGLTLRDVVFLRVFVAPDTVKGTRPDFPAWFRAYGEQFNNSSNPAKTARTTIGVAALVSPDALIEIEAVAVYPEKK